MGYPKVKYDYEKNMLFKPRSPSYPDPTIPLLDITDSGLTNPLSIHLNSVKLFIMSTSKIC